MAFKFLKQTNKGKFGVSKDQILDPRISRIEEKYANFCPKFLDLYASKSNNKLIQFEGRLSIKLACCIISTFSSLAPSVTQY